MPRGPRFSSPPPPPLVPFVSRSRAAREKVHSLVDVTLDPAQRAAVERPPGRALLVLGEAGHGKTTVALHRLAHLWKSARSAKSARSEPLRVAVVVPTEGLVRLLQPLLRRLGVNVEVQTYDRWASLQARRAFRRLPRESDTTPPSVMRLKRHPALRLVLDELAAREPGRIDDDVDGPARSRHETAHATRGDLQHLFGDRLLLERVADAGRLPRHAVTDTLDRTRVQFALTAEEEWAHVNRKRLVAVDRRALDEGTASGCAGTLDVEDYAVLAELDRLRAARASKAAGASAIAKKYDVVMLDEAQEIAPLELALIGRTLKADGTLIVAGDAHQQTDDAATFLGWDATMRELGCAAYDTVELEAGYRCPPDVVALARAIRDGAIRDGGPPNAPLASFDDEAALGAWLARDLTVLSRRDPRASVAVVCRSPLTARRLAARLRRAAVPCRLVFDGRFLPRGPVQVSTVDEVKGLEFDFVIVPDATARDYPDDAAARRALYVAVTRARHQVVLASVGARSPALA